MDNKNINEELNHNQIASKGKIFLSSILDFCCHMIILMILYAFVASPILSYGGFYDEYDNSKTAFFDYIKETKLYDFDENDEPINSKLSAAEYIKTIVKTNYYVENKPFEELVNGIKETTVLTEKDTLYYQEDGKYINDNMAQYFFNFRTSSDLPDDIKNHKEGYDNLTDYYYRELFNLKDASYRLYFNEALFNNGHIDNYIISQPILANQYAELLHDYIFLNVSSSEAQEVYNKLDFMYHHAVNLSFEELNNHSNIYQEKFASLTNAENYIYTSKVVSLLLCYLVSFTIYFVLIPLLVKENRTIGLRFNRLVYTTSKDRKPKAVNIIVKDIVLFLSQGLSIIFPVLFMGQFNWLFIPLGGWFRLIYLIMFFALMSLLSIIMAAWGKHHQFLCEYASNLVTKDTDSLKVSEEHAVIE